jgi:hypothetical protein
MSRPGASEPNSSAPRRLLSPRVTNRLPLKVRVMTKRVGSCLRNHASDSGKCLDGAEASLRAAICDQALTMLRGTRHDGSSRDGSSGSDNSRSISNAPRPRETRMLPSRNAMSVPTDDLHRN